MLRSTARRLTAVSLAAAILVAALVAISSATAAQRPQVLYRHFCPVTPAQVQAAGPYTLAR